MVKLSRFLAMVLTLSSLHAADWPQWMGPERDDVWREEGLADRFPADGPPLLWEMECGGGYAGPAVVDGRVFLPDRLPAAPAADAPENSVPGTERLLCLDAATGRTLWEYRRDTPNLISYGAGPRATPTVHDGRVYFLGIHGRLACLDVTDGKVIWEREIEKDYQCKAPTWGFAAGPVVFRDMLLCTAAGEGSCLIAFDLLTGKERWKSLTAKEPGYAPPLICGPPDSPRLVQWTGDAIFGVDPLTGREQWSIPWPIKNGVAISTPRAIGDHVFISSFWEGAKLLRLDPANAAPAVVWETERPSDTRTTHLNALMCPPVITGDFVYGVCSYGQLRGLNWRTGERLWEDREIVGKGEDIRWGTAFLTRLNNTDRYLCFTEHGELLVLSLTPEKCEVISRAPVIAPDCPDVKQRAVVWTHPAYADGRIFVRNNSRIRCFSMRAVTASR